jgi:hypothetical protein
VLKLSAVLLPDFLRVFAQNNVITSFYSYFTQVKVPKLQQLTINAEASTKIYIFVAKIIIFKEDLLSREIYKIEGSTSQSTFRPSTCLMHKYFSMFFLFYLVL